MAAAGQLPLHEGPPGGGKTAWPSNEASALLDRGSGGSTPWLSWKVLGPGLLACLADTDAGCLIVAAQSGARWRYSFVFLQLLLIPILFMTQELTIRLAAHTRKGQVACIWQYYGRHWAAVACCLLVFECLLAMISEMSGIAAVAELWGVPRSAAMIGAATAILSIIFFCTYEQVEALGITFGLFELTFVFMMFYYHPDPSEVVRDTFKLHTEPGWFKLVAANVGAVVMPWMIFFQQSALVARGVSGDGDVAKERASTLLGSVLTQLIMTGAIVTMAAVGRPRTLESVRDIVEALEPAMGEQMAKVMVSMAFFGGCLAAAFVVTLASSWAICDFVNQDSAPNSMDASPSSTTAFYSSCLMFMLIGLGVLGTGVNIMELNIVIEFVNGMLLPFTVTFLFLLATGPALPPGARVTGPHKALLVLVFTLCTALCLASFILMLTGKDGAGAAPLHT